MLERDIRKKALELGYEDCGIVRFTDLAGYREKLEERIAAIPMGGQAFERLKGYENPAAALPGMKSLVVAIIPFYRFVFPAELEGRIGKAYLFDNRQDPQAPYFQRRQEFAAYLEARGLKCLSGTGFGIPAPARWAAFKAGLGLIRRNNFFYTAKGSFNYIELFAIDRELELVRETPLEECPANCAQCVKSCPTQSLKGPYTMSMIECVSFQTNLAANRGMGIPSPEMAAGIGDWLYGCDACQDACPFNRGKWSGGEAFPGVAELLPSLRPERIMGMTEGEIASAFAEKFWYIQRENLWKWKVNALTVMANRYTPAYDEAIRRGLDAPEEQVRQYARVVCDKLGPS